MNVMISYTIIDKWKKKEKERLYGSVWFVKILMKEKDIDLLRIRARKRAIVIITYIFASARTCYNTVSETICSSIIVSNARMFLISNSSILMLRVDCCHLFHMYWHELSIQDVPIFENT